MPEVSIQYICCKEELQRGGGWFSMGEQQEKKYLQSSHDIPAAATSFPTRHEKGDIRPTHKQTCTHAHL